MHREKTPESSNSQEPIPQGRMQPTIDADGLYRNFEADRAPQDIFWETMKVTFDPTRGMWLRPSEKVLSSYFSFNPPRCAAPDGRDTKCTLLWLGHASVLLRFKPTEDADTISFLLDPMLEDSIPLLGPISLYDRMVPTGATLPELTNLTAALISHNHTDHCSEQTVEKLARQNPDMYFLAPDKTGTRLMQRHGVRHAIDHKWWEKSQIENTHSRVTLTFLPSDHSSSGRETACQEELWGGWKIELTSRRDESSHTIYMMGDSACNRHSQSSPKADHDTRMFDQICDALGPLHTILLPSDAPIGEQDMHLSLSQAGALLSEKFPNLQGKVVPTHYGSFAWGEGASRTTLFESQQRIRQEIVPQELAKFALQPDGSFYPVGSQIRLF